MSHVYCPECGFQNPESANYCAKCGSLLRTEESGETTMTFVPDEQEEEGTELEDFGIKGPALIVANHVTSIDIGFILAALPARFRHIRCKR